MIYALNPVPLNELYLPRNPVGIHLRINVSFTGEDEYFHSIYVYVKHGQS